MYLSSKVQIRYDFKNIKSMPTTFFIVTSISRSMIKSVSVNLEQDVLREAGYVASNSEKYPLGGIVTAVQNAFHITPEVVCKKDAIDEIRICFYKDFKVCFLDLFLF